MRRAVLAMLAALTVAAVTVFAWFQWDLAEARRRLVGHSEVVQTSFGPVEYAIVGRGEPVLAIHGAGGGFDQALQMTGALADRGYSVIAPSRFGYLRSPRPSGLSAAMQADAYAQLLDRLGVEKVAIVTISAGSWSGLQFALRHPQRCRALILLVPADYLPPGETIRGGPLVEAMFKSDFAAWAGVKAAEWAPGAFSASMLGTDANLVDAAPAAERARVRLIMEHLLPMRPRSAGVRFDAETAANRWPYPLGELQCPVLAISAEDDRFGTAARARQIARAAPNARLVVFPSGGHALVGRYGAALQAATDFLSSQRP